MSKNVIAILATRMTKVLEENVSLLKDDFRIILHVDKKSDISDFSAILPFVELTDERIAVYWGHASQIDATLSLVKKAVQEEFRYFSLMSEMCLPMKSPKEINEFFNHASEEFMEISSVVNPLG